MPYAENSDFARIYGDMDTGVWLAPKGSTLPTTIKTDPAAPFAAAGWLEGDISMGIEKDVKEFNALQGGSLVRKKVGKVTQTITFTCLEETALVLGLVYADQAITVTGTGAARVAKQNIADNQNKTIERALVVDTVDGDVWDRYCISAADLTFQGEISLANLEEMRLYKFEATIVAGAEAYHLTNSPGVLGTTP